MVRRLAQKTITEMVSFYIHNNVTLADAAKRYGVVENTLRRYCHRYGVNIKKPPLKGDKDTLPNDGVLPKRPDALIRMATTTLSDIEHHYGRIYLRHLHIGMDHTSIFVTAIMHDIFGAKSHQKVNPDDYPGDTNRLKALNAFSHGHVDKGLNYLDIDMTAMTPAHYTVPSYFEDPDIFVRRMRNLADILQEALPYRYPVEEIQEPLDTVDALP